MPGGYLPLLIAHTETTKLIQPCEGTFHDLYREQQAEQAKKQAEKAAAVN